MFATSATSVVWECLPFNELTPFQLYAALRLRSEVFVVEQSCVFLDTDNKDQQCYHLMGWQGAELMAYARLLAPGLAFSEASIGRVVSAPSARGTGAGRALMQEAIRRSYLLFGKVPIRIGGQLYLKVFYESFGFIQRSNIYEEDGIPHIEMILSVS